MQAVNSQNVPECWTCCSMIPDPLLFFKKLYFNGNNSCQKKLWVSISMHVNHYAWQQIACFFQIRVSENRKHLHPSKWRCIAFQNAPFPIHLWHDFQAMQLQKQGAGQSMCCTPHCPLPAEVQCSAGQPRSHFCHLSSQVYTELSPVHCQY